MTAPSNAGNNFYASVANETTVRINMPATVTQGQIAWCAIVASGNDQEFLFCRGGLLGWTPLIMTVPSASRRYAFLYRWCNGNEGGLQYTTSANIDSASRVAEAGVISDVDLSTGPHFVEDNTEASTSNPQSPAITFPWGIADSFVQSVIWSTGSPNAFTAPSGYINASSHHAGTGSAACAVADRQVTGASGNTPPAWTRAGTNAWVAATVAWKGKPESYKHAQPIRTLAIAANSGTNDHSIVIPEGRNRRVLVAIYLFNPGINAPTITLDPTGANLSLSLANKNSTNATSIWGPGEGRVSWFQLPGNSTPTAGTYTLRITSDYTYEACVVVLKDATSTDIQGITNRHNNSQTGDHSITSFGNSLLLTAHATDTGTSPAAQDRNVTIDSTPPLIIAASHGQTTDSDNSLRIYCRAAITAGSHSLNTEETAIQMMSTLSIGYVPPNSANAPLFAAIA